MGLTNSGYVLLAVGLGQPSTKASVYAPGPLALRKNPSIVWPIPIDINTSGLPARNIFAWILRYQFKITKADEYWRKMTNMRVTEHRWLLNNTKNTGQQ